MRNKEVVDDLLKSFRSIRNQVQSSSDVSRKEKPKTTFSKGYSKSRDKYSSFLEKYSSLEMYIDDFTTSDLMYFFRQKSEESGHKYVIPNIRKDMAIFKKLKDRYTPRAVCLMIEFLFNSDQNYISKDSITPNLLVSGFCNRIYKDSLLWAEDKYVPTPKKSKTKTVRERSREASEEDRATIGKWE